MNSLCPTCRKMLYRTDACKGDGMECGRTDGGSKKSTAARKDVQSGSSGVQGAATDGNREARKASEGLKSIAPSGNQAPPVDTPKPKYKDRHKPGYQAQKQREYRAQRKAKASVNLPSKGDSNA